MVNMNTIGVLSLFIDILAYVTQTIDERVKLTTLEEVLAPGVLYPYFE